MNYELALQLKNAGFPQPKNDSKWSGIYLGPDGTSVTIGWYAQMKDKTDAYIPTLEELIEACGDKFSELRSQNRPDGKWRAYAHVGHDEASGQERQRGLGSTPTEAVANLWLVLNPNPERK